MKSAEPLKYAPRMVPQTASKRSYWGGTTLVLFDNIQSEGDIQYAFLLGYSTTPPRNRFISSPPR